MNIHAAQPPRQALFFQHGAKLIHFTTKANRNHMRKIRMPREARQCAAQHPQRFIHGHAAAGFMRQRHHAIHIAPRRQRIITGDRVLFKLSRDQFRDMGGTIHGCDDADVIACRDAAIGATDPHEAGRYINIIGRLRILAPGVIPREIAHFAIMRMHPGARFNRIRRKANDLAVAANGLALRVRADRDLMARRDAPFAHADTGRDFRPRRQRNAGNHHTITRMQANDGRQGNGAGHGRSFLGGFDVPFTP